MGKNTFMKGALLGALIGTAVALFTTKKTGKQRQEEFKKAHPELSAKILEAVGKMKVMSKEKYDEIVEKAVMEYGKRKNLAKTQVAAVIKDLKAKWSDVKKQLK
ncbi:MAG: YtxH domain-containing protein [Patescibacteria group bacterium]